MRVASMISYLPHRTTHPDVLYAIYKKTRSSQ
jgi:hypothetical protein